MYDKSDFADKLKRYRIGRCWTQSQMGALLDLDKSTVCKMERGMYRFTDLAKARILKKLPDLDGGQA